MQLHLNANIKGFLCAYLRGRQAYVVFRNANSMYRKLKQGVPQGSLLSPILFNLYISTMPQPPWNIQIETYVHDSNILNSGPIVEPVVNEINHPTYLVEDKEPCYFPTKIHCHAIHHPI